MTRSASSSSGSSSRAGDTTALDRFSTMGSIWCTTLYENAVVAATATAGGVEDEEHRHRPPVGNARVDDEEHGGHDSHERQRAPEQQPPRREVRGERRQRDREAERRPPLLHREVLAPVAERRHNESRTSHGDDGGAELPVEAIAQR